MKNHARPAEFLLHDQFSEGQYHQSSVAPRERNSSLRGVVPLPPWRSSAPARAGLRRGPAPGMWPAREGNISSAHKDTRYSRGYLRKYENPCSSAMGTDIYSEKHDIIRASADRDECAPPKETTPCGASTNARRQHGRTNELAPPARKHAAPSTKARRASTRGAKTADPRAPPPTAAQLGMRRPIKRRNSRTRVPASAAPAHSYLPHVHGNNKLQGPPTPHRRKTRYHGPRQPPPRDGRQPRFLRAETNGVPRWEVHTASHGAAARRTSSPTTLPLDQPVEQRSADNHSVTRLLRSLIRAATAKAHAEKRRPNKHRGERGFGGIINFSGSQESSGKLPTGITTLNLSCDNTGMRPMKAPTESRTRLSRRHSARE